MYAKGKGNNCADNNKAEKSSGKCSESQTKWVTNMVLLQKGGGEKKQIYYGCDNGSAWQRVRVVIILFYLARVRL